MSEPLPYIETKERLILLEKQAEQQRQLLREVDPEQWVQDTILEEELLG